MVTATVLTLGVCSTILYFYSQHILVEDTFLGMIVAGILFELVHIFLAFKYVCIHTDKERYDQVLCLIHASCILQFALMVFYYSIGLFCYNGGDPLSNYIYMGCYGGIPVVAVIWLITHCLNLTLFKNECCPEARYSENACGEYKQLNDAIEEDYVSKYRTEYKTYQSELPQISLAVTQYETSYYKNDDYARFLIHMYTKVLLDCNVLAPEDYIVSRRHPLSSPWLANYVHMSCYYLGYTILKQVLLRMAFLSRNDNSLINMSNLYNTTHTEDNTKIIQEITDKGMQQAFASLVNSLNSRNYKQYYLELMQFIQKVGIELSSYNEKISKYSNINNKQLNKQLKQFVITNQSNRNKSEEIRLKKILYIVSECKFDIIVFDCIEDKYIKYIEDWLEYNREHEPKLWEKYQKHILEKNVIV